MVLRRNRRIYLPAVCAIKKLVTGRQGSGNLIKSWPPTRCEKRRESAPRPLKRSGWFRRRMGDDGSGCDDKLLTRLPILSRFQRGKFMWLRDKREFLRPSRQNQTVTSLFWEIFLLFGLSTDQSWRLVMHAPASLFTTAPALCSSQQF